MDHPSQRPRPAPPPRTARVIARPAIEARLDQVLERRIAVVTAAAGFGKSTLVQAWAERRRAAWYTVGPEDRSLRGLAVGIVDALGLRVPALQAEVADLVEAAGEPDAADEAERAGALAAAVATALERRLHRHLALVLDDVHESGRGTPGARFIEAFCRLAPARLHLVLASREELPFGIERLRVRGEVVDLPGSALAFSPAESSALLALAIGVDDPALAETLHRATAGWPAAVRLAAEALASVEPGRRAAALARWLSGGGVLFDRLAAEALAREPSDTVGLVEALALFDRASPGMLEAAGIPGAAERLADLERRGLYVQATGEGVWYALHPLVRHHVLAQGASPLGPSSAERCSVAHRRAAAWLAATGSTREAVEVLLSASCADELDALLRAEGRALVAGGEAATVLRACTALEARGAGDATDPELDLLAGDALQALGELDAALARFRRLAPASGPMSAALASRIGMIHHLRGDLEAALAVYDRGAPGGATVDGALLGAWHASARWLRGDTDGCRRLVSRALADATACNDARALATVHTVLAMLAAMDGDRRANDAHYLRALRYAEAAGDTLQVVRIHTNRGSRLVEEGDYGEAVVELGSAIRLAEVTGLTAFRALALSNRGEALTRLGRFEEATADLLQARALYQRMDSRMVSYPLGHLGEVYRLRGDRQLARAAFEEAIEVAEPGGDVQGLVPALAGLARVLATDEPRRAAALAERAVTHAQALAHVGALLARGWVALDQDDRALAARCAADASTAARSRRDRAGLAEAIELGVAADPGGVAAERLREAIEIWRDTGSAPALARAEATLATLGASATLPDRAAGDRAESPAAGGGGAPPGADVRTHRAAGLDRRPEIDRRPGGLAAADAAIRIRTLGGFGADGPAGPVPVSAWGSRKARDLVKILVARRGLPVPREQLQDLLWPDEGAGQAPRRLSVLLSTARHALDPERAHPADQAIAADRDAIRLVVERVRVDVLEFLAAAAAALEGEGAPPGGDRLDALRTAAAAYTGDFLEEDPYADWAVGLREEARAALLRVLRRLAGATEAAGDPESAAAWLRRILEREPYDEGAHLALVRVLGALGRHGAARRSYQAYAARMAELDVEPAPFPIPGDAAALGPASP